MDRYIVTLWWASPLATGMIPDNHKFSIAPDKYNANTLNIFLISMLKLEKTRKINIKLPSRYKNKPIYDEDMDDIDYELSEKAHQLAKKENLGITSDRELSFVIVDLIDNVVAASWVSWDGENYEFDVVVDKEHQGNKLGSALIDEHLEIPYEYLEENPDATMVLHVVNDTMKKALEKRNFIVKEGLTKDSCLMEKNTSNLSNNVTKRPKI